MICTMKKTIAIISFFVFFYLSLSAQIQFNSHFEDKTLRIDFFHSGNYEHEYFTLDEYIKEGQWAGSLINLIDTFYYGEFMVRVFDEKSNQLIYSRGFSSLFAEWRTTEPAHQACGNFQESVLIPFPKNEIRIEFYSRDSLDVFFKVEQMKFNPASKQYKIVQKPRYVVTKIQGNADIHKALDILLIPDGYTEAEKGKMLKDFAAISDYILDCTPFDAYKQAININGLIAFSQESGITDPENKIVRKTLVETSFNTINSDRYLMTLSHKMLRDVAAGIPYDQIIIVCNTDKYGGGGIYNFYSTVAAGNPNANFLVTHEFGHQLAGLGDEYYTSQVSVENFYKSTIEPWEPNLTTLVAFEKKWKNMLKADLSVPTLVSKENETVVGVYEGGGYVEKGVYRPMIDCTMKSVHYNQFCPVCRRAISQMLEYYR